MEKGADAPFFRNKEKRMYDIIIIGGGPAGLTAAVYARRGGRSVLLLEREGFGGQIAYAPRVENYPGIASIPGAELADHMLSQVLELDAETDVGEVVSVERGGDGIFLVRTEDGGEYSGRAVILATGARHRRLALPGEDELLGRGLSYCAVCDGGFYKNGTVAVVGGGDSALQEALLLSDICRTVYLINRRDTLRGDAAKQSQLFARENVKLITPMTVVGFETWDDGALRALQLRHAGTGAETLLAVDCLFVSIGREPELGAFSSLVPLTAKGYADAPETCDTPTPGLFTAGDCRFKSVRQLTTAVADGANAALAACGYLDALNG